MQLEKQVKPYFVTGKVSPGHVVVLIRSPRNSFTGFPEKDLGCRSDEFGDWFRAGSARLPSRNS